MSLYLTVFGKPRYLGLVNIGDLSLNAGRWVVIETLRGLEIGLLGGTLSQEQEGKYRSACADEPSDEHTRGPEPMLQEVTLVGPASESQIQEITVRRKDEDAVLIRSRQILQAHQFQMKLVDVEYTLDRKKLFFYFTSEQRVDFRAYVRDLAKEFRVRIEMRQIGVRDEAKTVKGVSPCGRPCCCSYWLHRFTPINIRMVKEQNLALNPTKISGICGRLMCCMSYEHSTYSELWKNLPNPGSKIKAPNGNYILEGVDLHREMVKINQPVGGSIAVPIVEFERFKETILRGEAWQKDEEDEKKDAGLGRLVSSRSRISKIPLSSRTQFSSASRKNTKAEDTQDSSAKNIKNNRRPKPEKISIKKHIADRLGESIQHLQSETLQDSPNLPNTQNQQDSQSEQKVEFKKRHRRRRIMPPDSRKQEEQAQTTKEYSKPPEQNQKNDSADATRAPGAYSHRSRYRGNNRGHDRHGNTGATKKGDS